MSYADTRQINNQYKPNYFIYLALIYSFMIPILFYVMKICYSKFIHIDPLKYNAILKKIHYSARKSMDDSKYLKACIKLLNKYPSAVNEPLTENGVTPFLKACMAGCEELISFMLKNGADVDIHSCNGEDAVYFVTYAMAMGKVTNFNSLKLLLDAGCSLNNRTKKNCTALHIAAFFGKIELVLWLLSNGADPVSIDHATAYDYAMMSGNFNTARLLENNFDD